MPTPLAVYIITVFVVYGAVLGTYIHAFYTKGTDKK